MKKQLVLLVSLFLLLINVSSVYAVNNPRNTYEVKAGDHLWKIANIYGTTVKDLKLINGLQSDTILVGQKLRIPIMYEVVNGDTIWELSQAFNSTVDLIKTKNGLTSNNIYVGQKIKITPKKLTMQGQYVLMTREEFRDWLFNHSFNRKIGKIQEHHTWSPAYQQFNGSNHFSMLKSMEGYHVEGMGWSNISQNLTIFPDGKVAVSRPFDTPPEGSFGLQNKSAMLAIEADSLAIENVGNFDKGQNQMTEEQKNTIVTVTALLSLKFGLTPSVDSITYHHWWDINTGERVLDNDKGHAVKSCPGTAFFGGNSTTSAKNNFYPLVSQKMKEIRASLK
ncbi:LysM peptidoglycan-binding domain-containing protein [Chengkuizengella axinellae]|uniref:LysM peptidoglycan-binding domain-containing protein n=1 Tax=Chengkuizengella axinellae TaxID=3064388 RepID=A0ABT9J6E5_9BACL|nr:LysM peptidoglycan-binding domain-containing protein [Chengkuizengella sp. 2205SS18-9]MDP5276570.1 LysM peptidoglycan-binding domain-containing protein [Chengkuizengella sp. 2205SS18-9]